MVATENGTRMTDKQMREAVEAIRHERLWTWERVIVEIGTTRDLFDPWIDGVNVAPLRLRSKLHQFIDKWRKPAPPAEIASSESEAAEPADEPTFDDEITGVFIAETSPGLWSLPAGFEAIAPASASTVARPPGVTISPRFDRVGITPALVAALGNPERVLVACNPLTKTLVVGPEREGYPALKVTKHRDLSKSVAVRAKALGVAPGFYAATDAGDGTWRIALAA